MQLQWCKGYLGEADVSNEHSEADSQMSTSTVKAGNVSVDEACERVGESSHRRAWLWPSHMTGTVGGGCHRYGYDQRQGEAARLARASLGEDLLSGSNFELHSQNKRYL